jgi:uncharacterized protein (DUF58 family)
MKRSRQKLNKPNKGKRGVILKAVICVLILAALAVPAVFMNTVYGWLPLLIFVAAALFSFVYLLLQRRMITFGELSDLTSCPRETDIDFSVRLKNRFALIFPKIESFFYISDLFGDDDTVTSSVFTLAPFEERNFNFSVRFDHIGTYSAGLKRIVIHDLLGLFSFTIDNPHRRKVDVAPKLFDVRDIYISDTAITESSKSIITTVSEGSDYTGVREYVWGDPIKTIHWKLSARADTYLTKQFETYGIVGITILLDFFSPKYDSETLMSLFDCIVETGLSVASYAERSGMEYEIIYTNRHGERKRTRKGARTDDVEIIQDMPRISVTEGGCAGPDLLREEGASRASHGNIVYVSANITDEAVNALLELKARGKNPLFFSAVPRAVAGEDREKLLAPMRMLSGTGIEWRALASAKELGGGELAS